MPRILLSLAVWGLAAILTAGCGSNGSSKIQVTGTVTLDGKPIEQGVINFTPSDGKGATAAASITNGSFSAEIPEGPKRVSITGQEVVGQQPARPGEASSPMIDILKEIVPPAFNQQSKLECTVTADKSELEFALQSDAVPAAVASGAPRR